MPSLSQTLLKHNQESLLCSTNCGSLRYKASVRSTSVHPQIFYSVADRVARVNVGTLAGGGVNRLLSGLTY